MQLDVVESYGRIDENTPQSQEMNPRVVAAAKTTLFEAQDKNVKRPITSRKASQGNKS